MKTNEYPSITIVTPSLNQGVYLEECILSILGQGYPRLEYIIMDGGSSDNSVDIIRKYQKYLSRWISAPDGGQYAAINEGFKGTSGEIMAWLNADDKLHSGALWKVAELFDTYKEVLWLTGRPTVWNDSGKLVHVVDPLPFWSRKKYLDGLIGPPHIQQESTFFRRLLWQLAGSTIDANLYYAGDLELWCRFFRHAGLYSVDTLIGGFRVHKGQKTEACDKYQEEALKIIEKERVFFETHEKDKPLTPPPPALVYPINKPAAVVSTPEYLISVIVSTYASELFIKECIEQLLSQTVSHKMEIIIVDAASPQREWEIILEYQRHHDNITIIRTGKRIGVYEAWNIAIRQAKGQFITTFSTNDALRLDAFEILSQTLIAHPDVALVYGDTILTHIPHETFDNHTKCGEYIWPEYSYEDLIQNCRVGPHPMWRKSIHETVGYFDETYTAIGDQDFWIRIGLRYKLIHLPQYTGLFWLTPQSISQNGQLPYDEIDKTHAKYQKLYLNKIKKKASYYKTFLKRQLLIWGTGSAGKLTLKILQNHSITVHGFIDNDSKKWNSTSTIDGLKVYSPDYIEKTRPLIIIATIYFNEIKPILNAIGYTERETYWTNIYEFKCLG
ncbi:MAG: glycosyltransferase [Candidatus Magnetoovum sp. WYHC-5]|nr:glycosyltransferase [Candidatus Magnetoovum sp. WYHC-5]